MRFRTLFENHTNKELIFAVDQRPDLSNSHNRMAYFSISGDSVRAARTASWTEKVSTDKLKRVFPIPQTAIDAASNIPGYLKQNDGY